MTQPSTLIVGGGIGGLTAALCLAKCGLSVDLFEQAPAFVEAGAGIQLSPNCSRVLHYLGLEGALRRQAFLPQGTQFRHWRSGKVISESALGDAAVQNYGAPYYHVHRGDLLKVLVDAAMANSRITLHLGAKVSGFDQDANGVRLLAGGETVAGELLVGADGIHSLVRSALWGDEKPSFTGNIAWRALVPVEQLPEGLIRPMSTAWWGPGKHFVHYYVRGGSMVNCVCVVEKDGWEVESWTAPGDYAELQSDFAGWHEDIQQLLLHADQDSLYKWALFDRAPMPQWGQGRITLLGDACHPTLPFMAQGAAMAIEDAAVLAGCLKQGGDIELRLKAYENLRRQRTASIQNGSRRNAKVFHLGGVKAWFRNRAVRAAGARTMDRLYRYNALEVAKLG
jgi:salicylate hydroxylase